MSRHTQDIPWRQDAAISGAKPEWGSAWRVRRARRQLMRKWAKRFSRRHGAHSWLAYCDTTARDGMYGAPWVRPTEG